MYWSLYISSFGGEKDSLLPGPRKAVQHSKSLSLSVPPVTYKERICLYVESEKERTGQ